MFELGVEKARGYTIPIIVNATVNPQLFAAE
jgi:hypothetical protein